MSRADWPTPAAYTHRATVRGLRDVPVRRSPYGGCWISAYEVGYALWHSRRDVADLRPINTATPDAREQQ